MEIQKKCSDLQVVVLLGGLGTRLKEYTADCPKPLVMVEGKPFFEYQLNLMRSWGFKRFIFCVGYYGEQIEAYFGDGSAFGISILYSYDGEVLLGTGGAVFKALKYLEEEFIVIYGDSFMDIDYDEVIYRYYNGKKNGKHLLMTIMRNENSFDKSNVVYENGEIILYSKTQPHTNMNYIDYGVCIFEKSLFSSYGQKQKFDLAEIQHSQSIDKKITVCIIINRFYEIGTPDSLNEFIIYVRKRFLSDNKAVFLDRDGVINEIVYVDETEQLDSPLNYNQFKLLPKVEDALRSINDKGYYIFVVTNQPAAAKGKVTLGKLYDINRTFVVEMNKKGIKIENILMCPHHPEGNSKTKEKFLIRECSCRKPKNGLIEKIMKRYCINREQSYMVGDSYTDIKAGALSGLQTVFVGNLKCDVCKMLDYDKPNLIVDSLYEYEKLLANLL